MSSGKVKETREAGRRGGEKKGLKVEKNWMIKNSFGSRYHVVKSKTGHENERWLCGFMTIIVGLGRTNNITFFVINNKVSLL